MLKWYVDKFDDSQSLCGFMDPELGGAGLDFIILGDDGKPDPVFVTTLIERLNKMEETIIELGKENEKLKKQVIDIHI